MIRFLAGLVFLAISSICSAEIVTATYSWTINYVNNPDGDDLLGREVAGTLTFEEVTVAGVDEVKSYNLISHVITIDGSVVTGVGETNHHGDARNSMTVVNNLYGGSLGDAVITESTANSEYSAFKLHTVAVLFSDPDAATLSSASVSKVALDTPFEFKEGRLLFSTIGTVGGGDEGVVGEDIMATSQAAIVFSSVTDNSSLSEVIECPLIYPSATNATRDWTVCDVKSGTIPGYTANAGQDYLMSYAVPKALSPSNKGRIKVYMHPSTPGDAFVSGTFTPSSDEIQIRVTEQGVYTAMSGSWWGYSGYNQSPALVDNYNGKIIAAAIDYVLENHGELVDLSLGIELTGASLGGTGAFIQSQILTKYQPYVTTASSFYGIMNPIEDSEGKFSPGWGTQAQSPDLYDSTDIRTQWDRVTDVHYHWAGGQDDVLGSISPNVLDACELRKLSCSFSWLQSGHGVTESGYTLPSDMWMNAAQDVTLDKILPVITNNTANHNGVLRGYHNRSVWWDHANITDTVTKVTIPMQYVAMTGIAPAGEIPDQPGTMTFSLTPRRITNLPAPVGATLNWAFGAQSGTVVVGADGLPTIDGLTLVSGEDWKNFELTPSAPVVSSGSIVYTRIARTLDTMVIDGQTISNFDFLDSMPEVGRQLNNFSGPGQLVLREANGTETIIYDCMNAAKPCVPFDAMPSIDGTKIAFAVYQSDALQPPYPQNQNYVGQHLNGVNSEAWILIYDIATQQTTAWPHTAGTHDINPVWTPDGKMVFSTDRDGYRKPHIRNYATSSTTKQVRLWKANADGSGAYDISPHELTAGLHPYLLNDGRLAYGAHWTTSLLAHHTTNGSINRPGTTLNSWPIMSIDYEGGDPMAEIGAHHANLENANSFDSTMKAMHFVGQRTNDDICATNYYRSNNNALGSIICWPDDPRIEGVAGTFNPAGHYSVAAWSTSEDSSSRIDGNGDYYGKLGWPEGTEDGQLMVTYGKGYCTNISHTVPSVNNLIGSQIGCDIGIYKTTVIPSTDPSDLTLIVDEPEWHEIGARLIQVRTIPTPTLSTTGDDTCELVSTDAGTIDIAPLRAYDFNNNYYNAAQNGAMMAEVPHTDMVGIKFLEIVPNQIGDPMVNNYGNVTKELGEVSLLTDKSFKVQLPCNTPFLMVGIDADGRAIVRDQAPMSLRTGEKRVCSGCHRHATAGPAYDANVDAFNVTATALLAATAAPSYAADIKPILDAKCASCHNPVDDIDDVDRVALWTYDGLVTDYFQYQVPASMKVLAEPTGTTDTKKYGLQKPQTSKYIHHLYARDSLLYWKAGNARTDGRTDGQYSDDIDFGADHPTTITTQELELIGDWIDSGAAE